MVLRADIQLILQEEVEPLHFLVELEVVVTEVLRALAQQLELAQAAAVVAVHQV
jgi:hypothetical protein